MLKNYLHAHKYHNTDTVQNITNFIITTNKNGFLNTLFRNNSGFYITPS